MAGHKFMLISSDGHAAAARMDDYIPYMDPDLRDDFREFCNLHTTVGRATNDVESLRGRLDPDVVDEWIEDVFWCC